jgi:hypothetical protein
MPTIAVKARLTPHAVTSRPCPECHGPLLLISVMPAKPGSLARLYQCLQCRHVEKVITNAKWLGWLNSELRPPN